MIELLVFANRKIHYGTKNITNVHAILSLIEKMEYVKFVIPVLIQVTMIQHVFVMVSSHTGTKYSTNACAMLVIMVL